MSLGDLWRKERRIQFYPTTAESANRPPEQIRSVGVYPTKCTSREKLATSVLYQLFWHLYEVCFAKPLPFMMGEP